MLKGGVSAGNVKTPTNFERGGSILSANYDYSYSNRLIAGIMLNPAIECPIKRNPGFAAGGYANINTISPVFDLEISFLFGSLRV